MFNFDKKIKTKDFSQILKFLGNNKKLNNFFIKSADSGLSI